MSFARILLTAVVSGLAACVHTPSNNSLYLPEVNSAAPILMVNGELPAGFDEHLVITIDYDGIARALESGNLDPGIRRFGISTQPYRYQPRRPSVSTVTTAGAPPAMVPAVSRPTHAPMTPPGDSSRNSGTRSTR